jgi:hypothetical protein
MQTPFDQADAESLYEQMRPDQRTAIALEFVRCLGLAEDPFAEQFMAEANQAETNQAEPNHAEQVQQGSAAEEPVVVTGGSPEPHRLLSAQQAAKIHRYAFERHRDCFTEVAQHPLTRAVLASPGTAPEAEPELESAAGSAQESPPTQDWPL